MSDTAPLPPPPPPSAEAAPETDQRGRNTLAALAVIGLALALVFGLLWLGVRGSRDDAANERDIALAERDAANENAISLSNELEATKDQLADAEAGEMADGSAETADLQAEVERLTEENERLTLENEALAAASDVSTTVAPPEPEPTEPEPTVAPTTAAPSDAAPLSAADLGAWLSSLYRESVLGEVQRECLGRNVLDDLGAALVDEILGSGDEASANEVLIESIEEAADVCGIDPSAVFG